MRERWGSAENVMAAYNPGRQSEMALHVDKVFSAESQAPSLYRFRATFGDDSAKAWMVLQLRQLGEYAGVKDKQTLPQMQETAEVIIAEFGYLKLTEIMLFLHRLKAGHYGRFYGAVDGIAICEGLNEFLHWRRDQIARLEREANERARAAQEERDKAECISYEEYLRRKEAMNAQK